MVKIDWYKFLSDYVWFGWYIAGPGWKVGHTRNPLIRWRVVSMDRVMADEFLYWDMDGTPRD